MLCDEPRFKGREQERCSNAAQYPTKHQHLILWGVLGDATQNVSDAVGDTSSPPAPAFTFENIKDFSFKSNKNFFPCQQHHNLQVFNHKLLTVYQPAIPQWFQTTWKIQIQQWRGDLYPLYQNHTGCRGSRHKDLAANLQLKSPNAIQISAMLSINTMLHKLIPKSQTKSTSKQQQRSILRPSKSPDPIPIANTNPIEFQKHNTRSKPQTRIISNPKW